MKEFASLICPVFGITGDAADQYEQALWKESKVYNWVLKKDGKVISALSTFVDGSVVSVWNVATDPAFRRQGYSNELWKEALNRAILKGCRTSMTYLTSEGMAFGICKGLGYETKWQFHAYLCPSEAGGSTH
jgi:ribosomal protein S18 acetylase RimI-like enzyme